MTPIDDNFSLLPADDAAIDENQDLALAAASVLDDPDSLPTPQDPDDPYGMTWQFDFEREQFIRRGSRPAEVNGISALYVWIETCLHTARGAFDAVADDAGMVDPDDPIGLVNPMERAADYELRMREALLEHDRIAEVGEFQSTYDPASGDFIVKFTVQTDDDESLEVQTAISPVTED